MDIDTADISTVRYFSADSDSTRIYVFPDFQWGTNSLFELVSTAIPEHPALLAQCDPTTFCEYGMERDDYYTLDLVFTTSQTPKLYVRGNRLMEVDVITGCKWSVRSTEDERDDDEAPVSDVEETCEVPLTSVQDLRNLLGRAIDWLDNSTYGSEGMFDSERDEWAKKVDSALGLGE